MDGHLVGLASVLEVSIEVDDIVSAKLEQSEGLAGAVSAVPP